ncbi:MAG TPA: hypothetical protein VFH27_16960 [Longimicrobiaceae bacterium]|nr:hypothetical protein [Longimicrobiaceae bacterium]
MSWDAKRAAALVGKTVVLRLYLIDEDGEAGKTLDQRGTIATAEEDGFTATASDGTSFTIPPELDTFSAAPAGTGAEMLSVWTVHGHGTGSEAWVPGRDAVPPKREGGSRWGRGGGPRRGGGGGGGGGGEGSSGPGRSPVRGPGGGRGRR